jgi:hypothetical protein
MADVSTWTCKRLIVGSDGLKQVAHGAVVYRKILGPQVESALIPGVRSLGYRKPWSPERFMDVLSKNPPQQVRALRDDRPRPSR